MVDLNDTTSPEEFPSVDPAGSTEQRIERFAQVLTRSTTQIKADRATEIAEMAEIETKRKVEDLEREVKLLERKKKSMTDLSPDNTYSIMKVKDFDPTEFLEAYTGLNIKLREAKILLNIAKETYNELFGKVYELINI